MSNKIKEREKNLFISKCVSMRRWKNLYPIKFHSLNIKNQNTSLPERDWNWMSKVILCVRDVFAFKLCDGKTNKIFEESMRVDCGKYVFYQREITERKLNWNDSDNHIKYYMIFHSSLVVHQFGWRKSVVLFHIRAAEETSKSNIRILLQNLWTSKIYITKHKCERQDEQ